MGGGTDRVEHVHDMDLDITVRKDDLTITAATATMARFPHAECPSITDAFGQLGRTLASVGATRAPCRNASAASAAVPISSNWPAPSVPWSFRP